MLCYYQRCLPTNQYTYYTFLRFPTLKDKTVKKTFIIGLCPSVRPSVCSRLQLWLYASSRELSRKHCVIAVAAEGFTEPLFITIITSHYPKSKKFALD